MAYKKKTIVLHRCGDCARVTPVLDKPNHFSIYGQPLIGRCPYWRESPCTLLSWQSTCIHFKPKKS